MFERNKIDNVPETTAVPVEIAFADGTIGKGCTPRSARRLRIH